VAKGADIRILNAVLVLVLGTPVPAYTCDFLLIGAFVGFMTFTLSSRITTTTIMPIE
jgi:hypothetical protein